MSLTVPDPGADFALVADELSTVVVKQIDPDVGATLATAGSVVCLQREQEVQTVAVGEGEVGATTCRFRLQAATVGFVPKERDQLVDGAGATWVLDRVEVLAFGTLYRVNGIKQR